MSTSFTSSRAARITRIVGHATWWLFVVAQVMKDAPAATGLPSRYRAYTPLTDAGWTAYTPLTSPGDFTDVNALATVSIVAILVCVIAATVEAIVARRWLSGALTVLAPIVGATLVVVGVEAQYGGVWNHVWLRPTLAAALVLLGVAVREIWARGFAPAAPAAPRS